MKKTYIEPETIVVALNVRDCVLLNESQFDPEDSEQMEAGDSFNSRKVIRSRNAWESW